MGKEVKICFMSIIKPFVKYSLKEGDTVESVAKQFDVSVNRLIIMHDICVEMHDKIKSPENGFPKHLTEIFITSETLEDYTKKQLMLRHRTPKIIFYRPTNKKLEYGVQFTIIDNDAVSILKFQTSIQYIERTEDKLNFILAIDRTSTTYFNDEDASIIADELAVLTASVLYPLQIIATGYGQFIGLNNYKDILKRWEIVKEKILKIYEGEWINNYITLNESTLADENLLFQSLQKDWFLAAYFNAIYTDHTNEYAIERAIHFPVIAQISPLQFTVNQTLNEYLDDNGNVVIEQRGTLSDDRNKEDLENNLNEAIYGLMHPEDKKANGTFISKYFLNPTNNLIDTLFIASSIELDKPQKIEIVISKIDNN